MSTRYYSPVPIQSEQVTLEGDEAHHLVHVMRARPGDRIIVIDGTGYEFDAEINSTKRRSVELTIAARREVNRECSHRLTIGVALPKGERQKWLVEKLTELGVAELVPLQTERNVAQPSAAVVQRLTRTVVEASKQCGRSRFMKIAPPQAFADFVKSGSPSAARLIAHPIGGAFEIAAKPNGKEIHCAVGPEGGFTDPEIETATSAGWIPISLGSRILRIETAAIALAARWSAC